MFERLGSIINRLQFMLPEADIHGDPPLLADPLSLRHCSGSVSEYNSLSTATGSSILSDLSRAKKKVPVPGGFRASLEGQIPRDVSGRIESAIGLKVSYETVRQIKEGTLERVTPIIAERIVMYMRKAGIPILEEPTALTPTPPVSGASVEGAAGKMMRSLHPKKPSKGDRKHGTR